MKFCVLALDYDGTIAENGKPDSAVMKAIQGARARGIVVVLVTGRVLSDLKKVAGDLDVFDAVVAENGAVLAFPNGRIRTLGRPPPQALLDELSRHKVEFAAGDCLLAGVGTAGHLNANARERLRTGCDFERGT